MKLFKENVWRGVTASCGVLLGLVFLLGNLALDRESDVSGFLHTTAPTTSTANGAYSRSYDTKEKLIAAEKEHNILMQEEGTVLLKNKNHALPLAASERSISLFGRASVEPIYRGQSGGKAFSGTSYHDALAAAGFKINETLFSAYQNSGVSRVCSSYEAVAAGSSKPSSIGEVPQSFYTAELQNSYASQYNDAAIVMFSRVAGEGKDLFTNDADGIPQLALHPQEKALLTLLKASKDAGVIKKIIVLINSGNPMDLIFLEDDATYGVDAGLVIGLPGDYGFEGVANVLTGAMTPSGRLADTWAANSMSSPAMQNFGDMTFSGMSTLYKNKYIACAEGVYVGYKYYESRYADCVNGLGNASGNYGVYAEGKTAWDYASEMAFPFGYGLSYGQFSESLKSLEWDRSSHQVKATVNVTYNGPESGSSYTGKASDVVELYASAPYLQGGAEKSAITLIDFARSKALGVGESEEVNFTVSDYFFANYDKAATNGKDNSKKGCYTFDAGDYYFALGNGAHDALNNVLALQGKSNLEDPAGNAVNGNSANAKAITGVTYDNKTYAVSPYTGEVVYNRFQDADLNTFIAGKLSYLSRSDYSHFPTPLAAFEPTEAMKTLIEGKTYETPKNAPAISTYKYAQSNNLKFIEMKDVPFTGEYTAADGTKKDGAATWASFLDQLTVAELCQIPGEVMGNKAVESVAYPTTVSQDGPDGYVNGYTLFVGEIVAAQSFDKDLLEKRGELYGEEALYTGLQEIYGPGADLHRTPYGGRNFEYYSEDGNLAYYLGQKQVNGMRDKGLISAIKHFVGNDQETNRHGVCTFYEEGAFRMNNLRAFEGALSLENSYGLMSSYNRIGCIPDAAYSALQSDLLRGEWGWKGVNLTDSSKDSASYMYTAESLAAGTNFFNNDAARSTEVKTLLTKNKDGYLWGKVRESAQYFFNAFLHSNIINGLTKTTVVTTYVPWWVPTVKGIQYGFVGLTALAAIFLGVSIFLSHKPTSLEGK